MEVASDGTAAALRLHVHVDALVVTGQAGTEVLAAALTQAVVGLELAQRITLAMRLRAVLHECIADAAADPTTLRRWARFLSAQGRAAEVQEGSAIEGAASVGPAALAVPATAPGTWSGRLGLGTAPWSAWSGILRFAVSLEALARGIHAVSRDFRQLALQPACWRGHDVTLCEAHLSGLGPRGGTAWGKAFTLLPLLREARTVRLAGFEDRSLRLRMLPPLRGACRVLCPRATLLCCSFCEHHRGEHIDLPTPRRLSAARKRVRDRGGGILIGNGPLAESQDGSRLFTLHIEDLGPGERLDIGVTSVAPHEHFTDRLSASRTHSHVCFAEDLLKSWIIESSGLLVGSHAGLRIRDSRWNARSLRTGDEVQLLVRTSGELALGVNGVEVAAWRAQIPCEAELYPVVDLFEGSPRVRLVPAAE